MGSCNDARITCARDPAETIVVTASRTGSSVDVLGGTVIEDHTIEILQPVSTLDLLDRVPGVRAFEKGGAGGPSYLSIRGGEPMPFSNLLMV